MSDAAARLPAGTWTDVQGFVTSAYGHLPRSGYLFVHFHDAAGARRWLSAIAGAVTTSARPAAAGGTHRVPSSALNIAFTADGLSVLGLPAGVLCTFPGDFRGGMADSQRSEILADIGRNAPDTWQLGGPHTTTLHAMLLVHEPSEAEVTRACDAQRRQIAATDNAVIEVPRSAQAGERPASGREPFGFRDGIAQPSILGLKGRGVPTGEFILGYRNHYQLLPPTPVVPASLDPRGLLPPWPNPYHPAGSLHDLGRNGSYVVYRKLHQDVAAFWRFMMAAGRSRTPAGADGAVWCASRAVGRWPGGAPLALSPDRDDPALSDADAFHYGDDAADTCPMSAHVRRSNPRDVLKLPYDPAQSLSMTEAHRLLRRGRVFGAPLFDHALLGPPLTAAAAEALARIEDDGRERGIHFLCVCASIRSQFEFVQQSWCTNPRFGGLNDQPDPLLPFVTMKGGAYCFMPGMAALRFLAAIGD